LSISERRSEARGRDTIVTARYATVVPPVCLFIGVKQKFSPS